VTRGRSVAMSIYWKNSGCYKAATRPIRVTGSAELSTHSPANTNCWLPFRAEHFRAEKKKGERFRSPFLVGAEAPIKFNAHGRWPEGQLYRLVTVQQHALGLLLADGAIEELVGLQVHLDEGGPLREGALDERLRQRVLDVLLQRPAERTRTIAEVHNRLVEDPLAGLFRHRDRDGALRQVLVQLLHHQFHDLDQVGLAERVEDNDLVETVEKLGVEGALHLAPHHVLDFGRGRLIKLRLEAHAGTFLQMPRADVRGHDDDGILEVHRIAQAIGELTIFKHLQQDVEQVRMRLLHFIEQHHGVGRALHALGQLAALFVADIAGRRSDQLRYGMFLHELRHVEAD